MISDYSVWDCSLKDYGSCIGWTCLLTVGVDLVCYRSIWALLLGIPLFWLVFRLAKEKKIKNRKALVFYHFRDLLASMRSSLRSGYSVENAVRDAARELQQTYGKTDPLVGELLAFRKKMELNVPVEQLFTDLGNRSGIDEIRTFVSVLSIAKRIGGSMEEVLDNTWEIFCMKIDTRQEIEGMIAARKYEMTVMSVVPFGILVYVQMAFPAFLTVLYGNPGGVMIMSCCLLIYLAAIWLEEKILQVEV